MAYQSAGNGYFILDMDPSDPPIVWKDQCLSRWLSYGLARPTSMPPGFIAYYPVGPKPDLPWCAFRGSLFGNGKGDGSAAVSATWAQAALISASNQDWGVPFSKVAPQFLLPNTLNLDAQNVIAPSNDATQAAAFAYARYRQLLAVFILKKACNSNMGSLEQAIGNLFGSDDLYGGDVYPVHLSEFAQFCPSQAPLSGSTPLPKACACAWATNELGLAPALAASCCHE